jgi:predicted membrane-bound spermidine synthase
MDPKALLWLSILFLLFLLMAARSRRRGESLPWVLILFFCSGFPALIYQIVWQRALFGFYGVNVESVTIVVSAFMFGLGIGSLWGGALSRRSNLPLLRLFAAAEIGTAAFGLISLRLFRAVAEFTAGASPLAVGVLSFTLVALPTILMGATLPLLVEHLVQRSRNVGYAVGALYFANTLGSAVACFVAGDVLMRVLGQSGSVGVAAAINLFVGSAAFIYSRRGRSPLPQSPDVDLERDPPASPPVTPLPFRFALLLSAFAGFLALAYEILWYRMMAFASGGIARVFAFLLGSYLLGIALGSRLIERYAQREGRRRAPLATLAWLLFASAIVSYSVGPLYAWLLGFASVFTLGGDSLSAHFLLLPLAGIAALFFGATFPLISHISVSADTRAGARLSYLYAANIAGSTSGSFLVGFVLMDRFSARTISSLLLAAGTVLAIVVLRYAAPGRTRWMPATAGALAAGLAVFFVSQPVFATLYDRLFFKHAFPAKHFEQVVETRGGVVAVSPDGVVYGGGAYDGHFNVDLLRDVNMILRPYALSAIHPSPRRVLMIGLGSGSWAQVVISNPEVEDLTVVEINDGYLPLIRQRSMVAGLLQNPRVHIIIDDGRRWMLHNRTCQFDAIVMNTTLHWRDHAANLLSADFLRIARQHLKPGGVMLYNATDSNEVLATALSVFPYALRIENSIAVSDAPLTFDRERWRSVLLRYRLNGRPVVDISSPQQMRDLDRIVNIPDDPGGNVVFSIEESEQLRRRLTGERIITDDNMLVEWRG